MGALFKNILEIGFGLLYLIGAIFNSLYTLRHGDEFYGSFAAQALFAPSKQFVQNVVIPHAKIFTGLLIAFELLAAFSLMSRGSLVAPGLLAGAVFCVIAACFSNTTGAVANLLMAAVQTFLALTR